MRLRLPELMAQHKPPLTAYAVAKASKGRISLSTIYRLNRNEGRVANFDGELLEALCEVFGVQPGKLLEREGTGGKRARRRRP
jgi:DNA-binding Xre family transcriptional regulator